MTATLDLTETDIQNMDAIELATTMNLAKRDRTITANKNVLSNNDYWRISRLYKIESWAELYLNAVNLKTTAQSISDTADDLEDTWGRV